MVTGKSDVIDKVVGLEMGADDYISKPFHVREVQARVRSAIRRSDFSAAIAPPSTTSTGTYTFQGWVADPQTFELKNPVGDSCELTTTDFRLLMLFLNSPKRVLTRDRIMDELNGNEWTPYDRTIDNQVARLRKKIEVDSSEPKIIKTVRGIGYTFASDVMKS
jgi:DNA-binding response OmpR family regulator